MAQLFVGVRDEEATIRDPARVASFTFPPVVTQPDQSNLIYERHCAMMSNVVRRGAMLMRNVAGARRQFASSATSSTAGEPAVMLELGQGKSGKVAIITLNDPKRMNALNIDMGDAFGDIVADLKGPRADEVGAVVLQGAGKAFSAGGDLGFLEDRHYDTPSRNAAIMRKFYSRFLAVRELPVPVVAGVNGAAVGAGLCLALACDMRVIAADARVGITFVGLGLHPGMAATHFLPRVCANHHFAARMMLTGDLVAGADACAQYGLGEVAPDGDAARAQALALADSIASKAPVAVRTCVRSIRMGQEDGLERALWREAGAQAECYGSADYLEGVRAIVEKRKPEFSCYERYDEGEVARE